VTPPEQVHRENVLITVKTYPLPSTTAHRESVCTAGVREDGSFIRLYPVNYRYRPIGQWFKKYSWVSVDVKRSRKGDHRPESFEPVGDFELRDWVSTKCNWAERKKYVLAQGVQTMCGLRRFEAEEKSLGIIRPRIVEGIVVEEVEREWKPGWKALFEQLSLLGPQQKPLEKIPFRFSYHFRCEEEGCNGHTMSISDWEIGQLFRSMRDKYQDEQRAVESVKARLLNDICGPEIDTHFFVGTTLEYGTWIVLGAFWPRKEQ
jgi:hypothetical protein